jgi:hypothetical protein
MFVDYIESFEKMLETALADDSVAQARPMSDSEIQYLGAFIKRKKQTRHPAIRAVNKDLQNTILGMISLIQSETEDSSKTHARKLLRRISEVALHMDSVEPRVIH